MYIKKHVKIKFWFLGLVLIFPWIINIYIVDSNLNFLNILNSTQNLVSFLKDRKDGRSTIEVFNYHIPAHHDMAASLPLNSNHQTIWNVFRESTLNSPFVMPLRNTFSVLPENFGVSCCLCGDEEFVGLDGKKSLSKQAARADLYALKYFIARHKPTFDAMFKDDNFHLISVFNDILGQWSLFSLNKDVSYAQSLKFEPVLVYFKPNIMYLRFDKNQKN